MSIATDANVRTTQAADKEGLSVALRVAFTGGAVMGFVVSIIYVCLLIFDTSCISGYISVYHMYLNICHVSHLFTHYHLLFYLPIIYSGCWIRTVRCIPLLLPNDTQP